MKLTREQKRQLELMLDGKLELSRDEQSFESSLSNVKNVKDIIALKLNKLNDFNRLKRIAIALTSNTFDWANEVIGSYFARNFQKEFRWIDESIDELNKKKQKNKKPGLDKVGSKKTRPTSQVKFELDGGNSKHSLTLEDDKEENCINILSDKKEVVARLSIVDVKTKTGGYKNGEYLLSFGPISKPMAVGINCIHVLGKKSEGTRISGNKKTITRKRFVR